MPLFTLWGIGVTAKHLWRLGIFMILAIAAYFAYSKVKDHFAHIAQLEQDNKTLKGDVTTLTQQKAEVVRLNHQNAEIYRGQLADAKANQNIAQTERAAAVARTQTYEELRNAIKNAPEPAVSISPSVARSVDGLWK